jgi:hypothetical protein
MKNYAILLLICWGCSCTGSKDPGKGPLESAASSQLELEISEFEHVDTDFLATLSSAGVIEAARQIGLDFNTTIKPLSRSVDHSYRRYRWSVDYHEGGGIMINALPPEEETGWTPWERWFRDDKGITRKESWVLFPLKDPTENGVARWYKLEENDLSPRYLNKPASLYDQLKRARIFDAAGVLGFDAEEMLIKPLSASGRAYYQQCRWVVIPHILGGDGPVLYILPPMDKSDEWPWESWYSDGKVKLIHHVHFTKKSKLTKGSWKEYPGVPQRPPEIFGPVWYWYDDLSLKPAMADIQ